MRRQKEFTKFYFISFLILLLFSIKASGQNKDGDIYTPESFSSHYIKITSVTVEGNKRTKARIIIRELDFKIGDSLATFEAGKIKLFGGEKRISRSDSSEVMKRLRFSRENVINTQLFLTVDIKLENIQGNEYKLNIDVKERWYFWVFPVVKLDAPNFNDWLKDPNWDLISMGIFTSHNNLWGLSHQSSLVAYFGNSQLYGFGYYIPWIGKGQKMGIRMGVVYSNSGSVEYGSVENERQMLYDNNSVEEWLVKAKLSIRPGLYNYGTISLEAYSTRISDTVFVLAPDYLPDGNKKVSNMNLYIDYAYDSRNNKSYPLKGNYLKGFVDKKGLGILSHDVDYFSYGLDFRFYQKLGKRFYVAEMFKAVSTSSQDIAYHFKENLTSGDDFIRGYDYFALRGDEMYYFRGNIKYELVKPTVRKPKKGKKDSKFKNIQYAFYINFFSDWAYMKDDFTVDNPYNNKGLYSWGLGLDLISYYDLVLRFEYAFTSIGTNGFYFGFGMPI